MFNRLTTDRYRHRRRAFWRVDSLVAACSIAAICLACFFTGFARSAFAQPSGPTNDRPAAADTDVRANAKKAFQRGTGLVAEARWAEALTAFQEANDLVPHAVTIYNIGACERALGRYTAARRTFALALAEHESKRSELPRDLVDDTHGFLVEIDKTLARVRVTVTPTQSTLLVDGRPLAETAHDEKSAESTVLVAGVLPPGAGTQVPRKSFVIELDPGRHALSFSRKGSAEVLVKRDFVSGVNLPIDLELDELPATIQIASSEKRSIVMLEGRDFGPAPVTILRPAGSYKLKVEKPGFVTYESTVTVKPGEQAKLAASLRKRERPLTEKWWFWTITSAAVTGVAVGTYFLARGSPEAKRADVGGGSLGWRVDVP